MLLPPTARLAVIVVLMVEFKFPVPTQLLRLAPLLIVCDSAFQLLSVPSAFPVLLTVLRLPVVFKPPFPVQLASTLMLSLVQHSDHRREDRLNYYLL